MYCLQPLHKYCDCKKIKREVWFSSLRKKVPKSCIKKPLILLFETGRSARRCPWNFKTTLEKNWGI